MNGDAWPDHESSELATTVDGVRYHAGAVEALLTELRLTLDNVAAAEEDGQRWVVKDNAARARQKAVRLLEAVARVYVAAEVLEDLGLHHAVPGATPRHG